jgi:hypothetical protein
MILLAVLVVLALALAFRIKSLLKILWIVIAATTIMTLALFYAYKDFSIQF